MLVQARQRGFLGPGPIDTHMAHARGFAAAAELGGYPPRTGLVADLGSGGGIPALVLGEMWPDARWLLVEAGQRRAAFLREALAALGWRERAVVCEERAETVGRDRAWRGACQLVVARGFGPPAVTAECAAGLLAVGGRLVVSEPPGGDPGRWPRAGLELLAMVPEATVVLPEGSFQVVGQVAPCPPRYPRRVGIPAKRPLF